MKTGSFRAMPAAVFLVSGLMFVAGPAAGATSLFAPVRNYWAGSVHFSVTVGDFNGDQKADLAVANEGGVTVSVLLGNGDGTFQPKADYGARAQPISVTSADFDGDGKADLAAADSASDNVSVLLNTAPSQVSSVSPTSGEQGKLTQGSADLRASSVSLDSLTRLTAQLSIPATFPSASTTCR